MEILERRDLHKVCKFCGSEAVWLDASAKWDVAEQKWVLRDTFEPAWCDTCGGETTIVDKEPTNA